MSEEQYYKLERIREDSGPSKAYLLAADFINQNNRSKDAILYFQGQNRLTGLSVRSRNPGGTSEFFVLRSDGNKTLEPWQGSTEEQHAFAAKLVSDLKVALDSGNIISYTATRLSPGGTPLSSLASDAINTVNSYYEMRNRAKSVGNIITNTITTPIVQEDPIERILRDYQEAGLIKFASPEARIDLIASLKAEFTKQQQKQQRNITKLPDL